MIPLDCSSIKCLCFTAMKCRSGTHFTEGLFGPLQYAPPEPLFLNYFIESFLPSIKDDREMQDVASGGCILSERFFAKCCPYLLTMLWKESAFYRGKLGQPWVLRCFKSICWPVWNRYSSWNWQSRVCHIYIYIYTYIYIYISPKIRGFKRFFVDYFMLLFPLLIIYERSKFLGDVLFLVC